MNTTKNEAEIKAVTRRIKALLTKTVEAGASEAEAMSAFTLAHKLLEQYQLTLSDLEVREQGTDRIILPMDEVAQKLSVRVGKYCECKVWQSDKQPVWKFVKVGTKEKKVYDGEKFTKINFIGIKSDADFAEWLMLALASYVQGKEIAYMFGDMCGTTQDAEDFTQGAVDRINERLLEEIKKREANKAKSTGRDLVPLKNAMITEAFAKLGITLAYTKNEQASRFVNMEAYGRGQNAGDGVSFNRPIRRDDSNEVKLLK